MSKRFTKKKADKGTRAQPALPPNARHDRSIADRGGLETIIRSCDGASHLRCFPARVSEEG